MTTDIPSFIRARTLHEAIALRVPNQILAVASVVTSGRRSRQRHSNLPALIALIPFNLVPTRPRNFIARVKDYRRHTHDSQGVSLYGCERDGVGC